MHTICVDRPVPSVCLAIQSALSSAPHRQRRHSSQLHEFGPPVLAAPGSELVQQVGPAPVPPRPPAPTLSSPCHDACPLIAALELEICIDVCVHYFMTVIRMGA